MFGKPEWFKYRVFGWGLAPKTWQGWVYIAVTAFLLGGSFALPISQSAKMWVFGGLLLLLLIDVVTIMVQLPKVSDERENYHQLIIERNCSFAAIIALLGVATYQTYKNTGFVAQAGTIPFDLSLVVILGAMLAAKIMSTLYVKYSM